MDLSRAERLYGEAAVLMSAVQALADDLTMLSAEVHGGGTARMHARELSEHAGIACVEIAQMKVIAYGLARSTE